MKKKICALFFVFMMLSASVYCREYAEGSATVRYIGTTADMTLDDLYASAWQAASEGYRLTTVDKLSNRQNRLLWKALNEYDYAAGELYFVAISETASMKLALCVCITADESCRWKGFYVTQE